MNTHNKKRHLTNKPNMICPLTSNPNKTNPLTNNRNMISPLTNNPNKTNPLTNNLNMISPLSNNPNKTIPLTHNKNLKNITILFRITKMPPKIGHIVIITRILAHKMIT